MLVSDSRKIRDELLLTVVKNDEEEFDDDESEQGRFEK
jgi:hypothetical protein